MDPYLTDLLSVIHSTPRPVDEKLVISAWEFAARAHADQFRRSGDPAISHATQVAKTLALWNLDTTTIISGLLHDTVEDTPVTLPELETKFGPDVALIVSGVTKISTIKLIGSTQDQFTENLRKMILVMAKDLRVILVKLADRLHNMQTLKFLPLEKQVTTAKETLEIYAPLAERLGMGEAKGQLEDLAFPYVYPSEYARLISQISPLVSSGQKYIEKFRRELHLLITPSFPGALINTRKKHLYSLFKKLNRPGIDGDLSLIHDLFAARIIVDTKEQCYEILGLIHGKFHPVPQLGISDFIALPKPNGYQSLHTKVFGPGGQIVELQIRTHAMHEEAEMGIAAHWFYSQAKTRGVANKTLEAGVFIPQKKLAWVKQLVNWQADIKDNSEYLNALKFDALQNRILVFSPLGDIYDLPKGATPVDYAYAVHTKLGHQTIGAKVNSKLVQLNHQLSNGDLVEILTDSKRKTPNSDWLNFVVTTTARRCISQVSK